MNAADSMKLSVETKAVETNAREDSVHLKSSIITDSGGDGGGEFNEEIQVGECTTRRQKLVRRGSQRIHHLRQQFYAGLQTGEAASGTEQRNQGGGGRQLKRSMTERSVRRPARDHSTDSGLSSPGSSLSHDEMFYEEGGQLQGRLIRHMSMDRMEINKHKLYRSICDLQSEAQKVQHIVDELTSTHTMRQRRTQTIGMSITARKQRATASLSSYISLAPGESEWGLRFDEMIARLRGCEPSPDDAHICHPECYDSNCALNKVNSSGETSDSTHSLSRVSSSPTTDINNTTTVESSILPADDDNEISNHPILDEEGNQTCNSLTLAEEVRQTADSSIQDVGSSILAEHDFRNTDNATAALTDNHNQTCDTPALTNDCNQILTPTNSQTSALELAANDESQADADNIFDESQLLDPFDNTCVLPELDPDTQGGADPELINHQPPNVCQQIEPEYHNKDEDEQPKHPLKQTDHLNNMTGLELISEKRLSYQHAILEEEDVIPAETVATQQICELFQPTDNHPANIVNERMCRSLSDESYKSSTGKPEIHNLLRSISLHRPDIATYNIPLGALRRTDSNNDVWIERPAIQDTYQRSCVSLTASTGKKPKPGGRWKKFTRVFSFRSRTNLNQQ